MLKYISRPVWILSLVSLFTDTASEMLYPIMPIYLKSIGFSIVLIGILEGFAEALAGLSKGYFGKLSDNSGKRVPFVQLGYSLSAISKPMMALFIFLYGFSSQERLIVLEKEFVRVREMLYCRMRLHLKPKGKFLAFIEEWILLGLF